MMQLVQLPISLYSFKVRLALVVMGIDISLVEPLGGSYRSAAYQTLVPPGTIPALLGPDGVLTESDAIVEYLDATFANSLFMKGPAWRNARVRMLTRLVDLRLEAGLRRLFAHVPASKRDVNEVDRAREQIDSALRVIEWAIDLDGPFAIDRAVSLADCSIAATSAWFEILHPVLLPNVKVGPRFQRVVDALRGDPVCGPPIAEYRLAVTGWIDSRLGS